MEERINELEKKIDILSEIVVDQGKIIDNQRKMIDLVEKLAKLSLEKTLDLVGIIEDISSLVPAEETTY